jgi:hypothetical protein
LTRKISIAARYAATKLVQGIQPHIGKRGIGGQARRC